MPEEIARPLPVVALLSAALAALLGLAGLALGQQSVSRRTGLSGPGPVVHGAPDDPLRDPREVHLRHVRQLTFGGQNAEAYFSFDGRRLIFQSTRVPYQCDQIFIMNADGSDARLVSTGRGRTTCGYFFPDGHRVLYSSTHLASPDCPPRPDYSRGYVWPVYPAYQIFLASDGGRIIRQLTTAPGYNAEATLSRDGRKIVFTSMRDGDLDIYSMDPNGRNVKRLTWELGYDGGPFYSPDGNWIVYRGHHPSAAEEVSRYKGLLAQGLVEPLEMDLYLMRSDGSERHPITHLGGASFAPSFFSDGQRIVFASNHASPRSSEFELYVTGREGGQVDQVTFAGGFNAFPVFSPDGRKVVFASNRNAPQPHEINVFIADWAP